MLTALTSVFAQARGPLAASGVVGLFTVALIGVLKVGLPIWSLAIVVGAAAYLFATIHRPVIGLLVVLGVFFVPLRLNIGVSLLQLVGGATAAIVMLWFLYERRRIVLSPVQIPLLLLGALILISFSFTLDVSVSLFYVRRWVFNMLLVLLMLNLVTTMEALKRVVWTVIVMAVINSTFGMLDFSQSGELNYRSMGLMENPNSFGHFAALAFPLALYQYLYRKGFMRVAGLVCSACLFGGIVTSVSRGALLSLLVVIGVTFVRERRRLIPLLLIVVLGLGSTPLLPDYFRERAGNLVDDVTNSLSIQKSQGLTSRGSLNSAGLNIWWAHPVMGVGVGNFGRYYVQRDFVEDLRARENIVAHNIYVQALAETGLIGFGTLLWLLLYSVRGVWRARRRCEQDSEAWIYYGAVEMMALAVLVSTASSGNLMANDFWLFVALTAVAARIHEARSNEAQVSGEEAMA